MVVTISLCGCVTEQMWYNLECSISVIEILNNNAYIYIYIYIYIYFKKKQRNRSHRIINLFQSCYAFLKFPKTRKKLTGLLQIFLIKKTRIDT